jgi:hypothetical protein
MAAPLKSSPRIGDSTMPSELLGRRAGPAAPVVGRPVARCESDLLHLPGGEWLYAKPYATEPAQ